MVMITMTTYPSRTRYLGVVSADLVRTEIQDVVVEIISLFLSPRSDSVLYR